MTPIDESLPAGRILLDAAASDPAGALAAVAGLLRGEPGVRDFPTLERELRAREPAGFENDDCLVRIAHARTESVETLMMAAGRFRLPDTPPLLLFVAGIPAAFNTEYLRAVGVIARACKSDASRAALLGAASPDAFARTLRSVELAL